MGLEKISRLTIHSEVCCIEHITSKDLYKLLFHARVNNIDIVFALYELSLRDHLEEDGNIAIPHRPTSTIQPWQR
jgi:hypothetical protein